MKKIIAIAFVTALFGAGGAADRLRGPGVTGSPAGP